MYAVQSSTLSPSPHAFHDRRLRHVWLCSGRCFDHGSADGLSTECESAGLFDDSLVDWQWLTVDLDDVLYVESGQSGVGGE